MKRLRQTQFEFVGNSRSLAFGGSLLRQKRNRGARPLSVKHPVHLVFKSSKAKGHHSFLSPRSRRVLHSTLRQMGRRYGLKFLEVGICGNHFHLLVKLQNRRLMLAFMKVFTGTLVKRICGYQKLAEKFFDFRPFSRIVQGRRGFVIAKDYVLLNQLEGLGIIPYQKERTRSESWKDRRSRHPQFSVPSG